MPRYDFRCAAGHAFELEVTRDERAAPCRCGLTARRELSVGVGISGTRPTPTRLRDVNVSRAVEAQHEIVHRSEQAGVTPPDFLGEAKRRIAAGEVRAIG